MPTPPTGAPATLRTGGSALGALQRALRICALVFGSIWIVPTGCTVFTALMPYGINHAGPALRREIRPGGDTQRLYGALFHVVAWPDRSGQPASAPPASAVQPGGAQPGGTQPPGAQPASTEPASAVPLGLTQLPEFKADHPGYSFRPPDPAGEMFGYLRYRVVSATAGEQIVEVEEEPDSLAALRIFSRYRATAHEVTPISLYILGGEFLFAPIVLAFALYALGLEARFLVKLQQGRQPRPPAGDGGAPSDAG